MSIKVETALLCDDIRQEVSGKYILIGFYSGDVLVKRMPIEIPMAFLIMLSHPATPATYSLEVRLDLPGLKRSEIMRTEISNETQALSALELRVPNIQFKEPGRFRLLFREQGQRWKTIIAKNVVAG